MRAINWRVAPAQLGIIVTFLLTPLWLRMPYAPTTYHPFYSFGFAITLPMLWTIGTWILAGFPGLGDLWRDRMRSLWIALLIALGLWMAISVNWSFIADVRDLPNVTNSTAIQFGLVMLWTLVVLCIRPSPRLIVGLLIVNGVIHAVIGGIQVANQGSIGLDFLGEFSLYPDQSGTSIVTANEVRWLRPYGLLPHPNVYAGVLLIALLGCVAWIVRNDRWRWIGTGAFLLILWSFFLTFSRSAWLGLIIGALVLLPLLMRGKLHDKTTRRGLLLAIGLSIIAGGVFLTLYQPYIISRTQVGASIEMRSVADRIVFTDFALRAVSESPQNTLIGIGAGNFPWRSSYYLIDTDYDLRGNNVHHVWLTMIVENGIIGFSLFVGAIMLGIDLALRQFKRDLIIERGILLAIIPALGFIGLFDHYPVTLLQIQVMWWGVLAIALSPPRKSNASADEVRFQPVPQ